MHAGEEIIKCSLAAAAAKAPHSYDLAPKFIPLIQKADFVAFTADAVPQIICSHKYI